MTADWTLLIRNALVFDGTGAPPRREDIAIANGRIAARGPALDPTRADHVIDASGRWLMPGLLDIHTHLDLEVELAPGLPESVRHGTTTVVVGNCSLGTAFGSQRRNGDDPILDCFARVENIPKSVLRKVVDRIDWDTTAGYLQHLDSLPLGPNVVPLLPHSMLRIEVMGTAAAVSRAPTADELRRMRAAARDGDAAGLCGLLDRRHSVPLPRERSAHRQAHPRPARDARGTQVAARRRARARPRLAVHARRCEPHQDVPAFLLHQWPAFRQATADVRAHGRGPHARAKHLEAVPGDRGPAELAARRRPVSFPGAGDALPHVRGRRDLPDLRGIRLVAAAHVVRHRGRRRAPSHHGDRRIRRTLRQRVARLGRRVDIQS